MNEHAINKLLVEQLSNNEMFKLAFYGPDGDGRNEIKRYVLDNDIKNVEFYGTYKKEDITQIYAENADFVNIIRRKCDVNKNALPNKMYDAIGAGKPIIVFSHNTAIANYAWKYNLGIVLPDGAEINFAESIEKSIASFDYEKYVRGRIEFIDEVLDSSDEFLKTLSIFAKGVTI